MKYITALVFAFASIVMATPRGTPDGRSYTIVKRDDDYNTTCSNQQWQSWPVGALSKKVKDMGGTTDGITFWKDGDHNDRTVDDNGCSEVNEACNCKGGAWICGYGDKTPVVAQADLSKWMGNSMTDCGIQWGNSDKNDYDGIWGIQIWRADFNIIIAGGANSCKGC